MKGLMRLLLSGALCLSLGAPAVAQEADLAPILNVPREAFRPTSQDPSLFYYVKPGVDLRQYSSVLVEPLSVLDQGPDNQWNALVSDASAGAPAYFQQQLIAALKQQGVAVAQAPGSGVLVLRVAITHASQENYGFRVTDVLPVKAVFNLARYALGKNPYIFKVSTLAQLTDSQSGALMAGGVGLRHEGKSGAQPMTREELDQFLAKWALQVAHYVGQGLKLPPAGLP